MYRWPQVWFCLRRCGSGERKGSSGIRKSLSAEALELFVVLDQGKDVEAGEFGAAFQECQLYSEGQAFYFAAQLLNESGGGCGGAAGGQQIIADYDAITGLDGVFMDFQRVGAVFQRVRDAGAFGGEFFRFAHWNESGVKTIG